MNRKTTYVFTVACVMLLASCKDKKKAETYTAYRVATLSPTSVEIEESYSASIQGRQDIDIYPQVPGTITRLCVKEGQQVRKGQVLFVIDQVPYRATWNKAVADVHAAEAQARTARLEYRSKQVLFDKQVISEYELTTAKNALDAAEAMLEQMKALEQSARNNLSYTEVKSPSDGMVGTLPYRTGALVSSSIPQPLTTVSDNSETYVYFSLTENRLRSMLRRYGSLDKTINEMPAIGLQLNDGTLYPEKGRIRSISGIINKQTGTVSVCGVFPNTGKLLLSGGIGNVIIPHKEEEVIVIPQTATTELQDKILVYKVSESGHKKNDFVCRTDRRETERRQTLHCPFRTFGWRCNCNRRRGTAARRDEDKHKRRMTFGKLNI